MDLAVVDWSQWRRILPFRSEDEEKGVLRLDILSLRSSLIHMREEAVVADQEELRSLSAAQILWQIGRTVLLGYEFGNECIEMMGVLAYFHPIAINFRVFESEQHISKIFMLRDLGFLTMRRVQPSGDTLISTEFQSLIDEIRQKNLQHEVQFLRKIIELLISCKTHLQSYGWYWRDAMTPIWKHALTHSHGIHFIRDYRQVWEAYLKDLLECYYHSNVEKEVLSRALEIYCVEYGNKGWKTMGLRFIQFLLFLREEIGTNEDVKTLLTYSCYYRSLGTNHFGIGRIFGYVPYIPFQRSSPKQQQIAELFYENALKLNDVNSKTLLLQEALAYCVIGHNSWRRGTPDNGGDVCLVVRLQCLYELGRCDEMVAYMTEIREILMRHQFSLAMHWYPQSVFEAAQEMERNGKDMILNELSIFLNHFYNMGGMGFSEDKYILECLIDYEASLEKWDRILVMMREKRDLWRAHIIGGRAEAWVELESKLIDVFKNSTDGLVDELGNASLEFTKQLVELRLNDGTYGEKYIVNKLPINSFNDPLVHVITIFLVKGRHEELLSYMLEYEKLLEDKYGDRIGPVTNGILLFGVWITAQLEYQTNIGNKFEELLQGVKAMTQNRMSIISNHPGEMKSWMEESADLISSECDSYLAQN